MNDTPTARNEKISGSNRRGSAIGCGSRELDADDDEMMTLAATCVFFGGTDRPIHYSTLYRGIAAGRYPRPVAIGPNTKRWLRSECRAARAALIAAREGGDKVEAA